MGKDGTPKEGENAIHPNDECPAQVTDGVPKRRRLINDRVERSRDGVDSQKEIADRGPCRAFAPCFNTSIVW